MPAQRLMEFLADHHVKFITISHSPAFTAQEIAATAHIPGKQLAKTVVVKIDGKVALAVLSALDMVSLEGLKKATGAEMVELASEEEFSDLFPGCEVGAMPPFGNLWDLNVFVDQRLREDEHIAFNAGSFTELVQLSYSDFESLVHPTVVRLSTGN